MKKISVSIAGASGYAGGELIRLLLFHPFVQLKQLTSDRFAGKPVYKVHPNLRTYKMLKFCKKEELQKCDILFLCLPHKEAMKNICHYIDKANKIIDLSGDFRLNSLTRYEKWYGKHQAPEFLNKFVYGIPELHGKEMKNADFVSSAGCNATAVILALFPLFKNKVANLTQAVVEVKAGPSQGGNKFSEHSHHPERSGSVRTYKATTHRHTGEMEQELSFENDKVKIHFSATSIEMVRGVHATCHVFLNRNLTEKDIWKLYRQEYKECPFIRIVKEKDGIYRLPDPKILAGTNYCDIGFEKDPLSNRLVVISAIDNLMKGAAGQAVQAFNILNGFDETTALTFPGLHPV
jgi:N-acetyl-gamma-glutamyl-phosphate/LysW-gamma-L-alpha-aminoadipyl-6-phosphate reductase